MKIYRKKHRPLPVSFFAFQDIITALAGCMLIFVLTLAAAKNCTAPEDVPGSSFEQKDYDFLIEKIRLSRSMLADEEKKTALLRQQFDREQLNEQYKNLNQRLKNSSNQLEKVIQQRSQMLENMQKELALLKKQNQQLAAVQPELLELVKQAGNLEKKYRDQQKKLVFTDNSTRKNIVLTVSKKSWLLQIKAAGTTENLGSGIDSMGRLKEKLRSLDPAHLRLIIAVRPSAGGFAEILKNELKKSFPAMETVAEPLADETLGGVKL